MRSLLSLVELGAGYSNLTALFNFFNPALMLSPALPHVLVVADLLFSRRAAFGAVLDRVFRSLYDD